MFRCLSKKARLERRHAFIKLKSHYIRNTYAKSVAEPHKKNSIFGFTDADPCEFETAGQSRDSYSNSVHSKESGADLRKLEGLFKLAGVVQRKIF